MKFWWKHFNESLSNHQLKAESNFEESFCEDAASNASGSYVCGGTGGWRHVVYLNMTDPNSTCPFSWQLTGYSKRTCGRVSDGQRTCDPTTFPVTGGAYSKLCGRIRAYQWGGTTAFYSYHSRQVTTIESAYVDGVSLTHGHPRQHIWTFAAGLSENNQLNINVCPCDTSAHINIPPFVDEDYFCESGLYSPWAGQHVLHDDPLWDGEECLPGSRCCSLHDPPYFIKELPFPTTDDVEARICLNQGLRNENIAVELVELYAQ